jgi:molybdate transport system substrate-binding protein
MWKWLFVLFFCFFLQSAPSYADDIPVIAAASDLQFALEEVAILFQQQTGKNIKIAFGSSGNFRHQISHGAPFQMYMSADEEYVLALYREGHTLDEGTLYAIGRIAIFIPHGSPLKPDGSLEDLEMALNDNRIKRFAIANPDHAPYGHRAEEALRHAGIWDRIRSRLVLGENVSQAAQFAASGSAQGGIIAYSLALSPNMAPLGDYDLIPAEWHNPLRQRMVLLKNAGPTAHAFYNFVQSPPARKILEQYGFALPDEYN